MAVPSSSGSPHCCFQFTYLSIEGYTNLLGRKIEKHVTIADYHLHSCMFNSSSKQFVGRFHDSMNCGLVESLQSGAVVCPIEQTAFFHSPRPDPSLLLVTELTASFLSGGTEQSVVLGWAMLPVFHHRNKSSTTMGGAADSVRLPLYEGTPRALYSMPHPSSDSKELVPIPGCILTCALHPHPTLGKAIHLFPENTMVSYDDVIPGLIPTMVHEAFPKLVRTTSGTLEKVSLLLLPSVNDFEEQLLSQLADDLCTQDGGDTTTITIEERRMKITQYNGWQFTNSPTIGYLEKASPSTRGSSLRGSSSGYPRNNLILKGSLDLTDIVTHPLVEVVLQLEYIVSWSGVAMVMKAGTTTSRSRGSNNTKPSSTHSTTLTLAWGVWQPFDSDASPGAEEESQISIDLKTGPGFKPTVIPNSAHNACYQGSLSDAGRMAFKFVPAKASARPEGSQLFTSSISIGHSEDFTPRRGTTRAGKDTPDTGEVTERQMKTREEPRLPHPPVTSTPARPPRHDSPQPEALDPAHLNSPVEVKATSHHLIAVTQPRTSHGVSRSVLAHLHSAGFEEFQDSKGNPLPAATDPPTLRSTSSTDDVLHSGPYQIAVQLMAISLDWSPEAKPPKSVVLSYQFFHFQPAVSDRCQLVKPGDREGKGLPLILQPGEEGSQPGIVHCYSVTHQTLPSKADRNDFTSYLTSSHLHVDVYDGESLILIGTASMALKGLLYPAEEYFQSTLSSPIAFSQSTLDTSLTNITMDSTGRSGEQIRGNLYLRLAKLHMDNRDAESPSKRSAQRQMRLARRLYGCDIPQEKNEDELTRKRKCARMQSVREMQLTHKSSDPQVLLTHPSRVPPLSSQLNIIDIQREELRRETISAVLEESITSSYTIKPRTGRVVYFEHEFRNVHNHPLSVTVTWKDPDLKLVTDRKECHYLRQLHSIHTAIDDNLITESPENGHYTFFIHPNETVRVPFKYQRFQVPAVIIDTALQDGGKKTASKLIKVYFQSSQRDLLGILNIQVDPLHQRVDRVFHFYHPERTFLKKHFQLQPNSLLQSGGDMADSDLELFACSSEPDIICEMRQTNGSRSMYIKAPVKGAPAVHSFFILLYSQRYLVSPSEVWQVVIHSVHRADQFLVLGQSSVLKLSLHGNHTNRRVTCYSLNGPSVKVVTPSPFLLSAHSLSELQVSLKTLTPGNSHVIITTIDIDSKQLVDAWLVHTTSQEPSISRAFQINLSTGGNTPTQKTITFTNPYARHKKFLLSTNHPNTITFTSNTVKLQPQETSVIGLQFAPSPHQLSADILVFINDELDQTEECFLVKTLYS